MPRAKLAATVRRAEGAAAKAAILSILLVLLASLGAAPAQAQGSGITVINVPPQFSGIDIRSVGGLNYIDVTVSDYNSWEDIFRVRVEVLAVDGGTESSVAFQQYPTNTSSSRQPGFDQTVGEYLVRDLTSEDHSTQTTTVPDRTEMHLTFVLSPVKGQWINVTASDRGGLTAYAQVEYAGGFLGGLPTVAGWILVAVSIVFAVFVVARRIGRDRHGK